MERDKALIIIVASVIGLGLFLIILGSLLCLKESSKEAGQGLIIFGGFIICMILMGDYSDKNDDNDQDESEEDDPPPEQPESKPTEQIGGRF